MKDEGVKNRDDAKRMVANDWKTAQNVRLTESENEDNIMNMKFTFYFVENNIQLA